jgi:hypothetical protein
MVSIIKEIPMDIFVGNISLSLIVSVTDRQRHIQPVIRQGGSKQLTTLCNFLM